MHAFRQHRGVAAPLLRINIDTDAIIPSREMRTVTKKGLAPGLFAGWRYQAPNSREPNPDFVLNQPDYANCSILLAGSNFGCGSSREHAVWALDEYGIRCVIAPSFGSIFENNCIRNGLLPICLAEKHIQDIADCVKTDPQRHQIDINLERSRLEVGELSFPFLLEESARHMLLNGLDPIGLTLEQADDIEAKIEQDRQERPWVYSNTRL